VFSTELVTSNLSLGTNLFLSSQGDRMCLLELWLPL
jgi:hypothetical protein